MSAHSKLNVDTVSNLARLKLSNQEKKAITKDLNNILVYIEKLGELDTASIEATSHVLNIENVYRDDSVSHSRTAPDVLHVLPHTRKNDPFFKVPKIIEDA